ncbi:uncharacterized protein LOC114927917 isoform X1 [Nylanderia fulva]|uniref:uncharacterized protein LOC114927917 isoform X1 n=1 Tax=Nylanderia fulva TaxID=613905 RepID=UPI0010FB549C|nr:uncharacterized protein LOC114927917 isoform X1 [Nylanderia fulva]
MTLPQFFCTIILFIGITSVKTYSVSYQNIPLAFSNTPRLIYTESESNPAFSGYSYATQDLNGGESNVIFTTGADSLSRLQHEMDSMKPSEGYSEKNMLEKRVNSVSSEQQSKSEKASMTEQENFNSSVENSRKGKKLSKSFEADNNFVEYQAPLQQISFVPYSTLRANLLNFPTVLPRYHVSPDAVQNYYLHNPYSQLKLPLHNFNLYNPIVPLFYQATTNPNSSIRYQTSIAAQNSKISLESNNTKSSEINSTISESSSTESNIIESRSDLGSMEDAADKTSNKSDISADKLELVTKKVEEEITSSKSVKSAVTETFDEQTIEDKTNTTELANTETSTSKEKSTTVSSQRRISIYQ